MTIEQKAIAKWGITESPEFASYILTDGRYLNGSRENRQRDMDHADISEFFKRSKKDTSGFSTLYIEKFMRRGNIRVGASPTGYYIELAKLPTPAQVHVMRSLAIKAFRMGLDIHIDWHTARGKLRSGKWTDYLSYLASYTDLALIGLM